MDSQTPDAKHIYLKIRKDPSVDQVKGDSSWHFKTLFPDLAYLKDQNRYYAKIKEIIDKDFSINEVFVNERDKYQSMPHLHDELISLLNQEIANDTRYISLISSQIEKKYLHLALEKMRKWKMSGKNKDSDEGKKIVAFLEVLRFAFSSWEYRNVIQKLWSNITYPQDLSYRCPCGELASSDYSDREGKFTLDPHLDPSGKLCSMYKTYFDDHVDEEALNNTLHRLWDQKKKATLLSLNKLATKSKWPKVREGDKDNPLDPEAFNKAWDRDIGRAMAEVCDKNFFQENYNEREILKFKSVHPKATNEYLLTCMFRHYLSVGPYLPLINVFPEYESLWYELTKHVKWDLRSVFEMSTQDTGMSNAGMVVKKANELYDLVGSHVDKPEGQKKIKDIISKTAYSFTGVRELVLQNQDHKLFHNSLQYLKKGNDYTKGIAELTGDIVNKELRQIVTDIFITQSSMRNTYICPCGAKILIFVASIKVGNKRKPYHIIRSHFTPKKNICPHSRKVLGEYDEDDAFITGNGQSQGGDLLEKYKESLK